MAEQTARENLLHFVINVRIDCVYVYLYMLGCVSFAAVLSLVLRETVDRVRFSVSFRLGSD